MDQHGRRGPLIVGVAAMVLGAVLIGVAVTDRPSRPHVLGQTITAPTTTTSAPPTTSAPAPTRAIRGIPPRQSQFSGAGGAKTATTVEDARSSTPTPTSTSTSSTSTSTTTSTSTSTTSTTARPCPAGEPVAVVRTWDGGAADADGVWRVTVTGAVTNRTGATVEVDAVAIVFTRADGTTTEVPAEQRPQPEPRTIADGAEASWRFDGTIPSGAEPTDVTVAVAAWRWPAGARPAGCA